MNTEKGETNLEHFSFVDHRSSYEPLLFSFDRRHAIVEDCNDFWKFITKYETMLKRIGQPILQSPLAKKNYFELMPYHKLKSVCLHLNIDESENINKNGSKKTNQGRHFTLKERQFLEIVMIYLDFKQKEKFAKIKKLRKAQKGLPMWQFKSQLAKTLNETQVLIIAGDTGCGKSTQVPQYLYEFGYRSIGKF